MPSLICDVRNCSYNDENYCCLSAIEVGGAGASNSIATCCESFNGSSYAASNCVKEKQPSVAIACTACDCVHNENKNCMADCVPITGTSTSCCSVEDTLCGAFVSK